jgi:hypothetical protein
MNELGVPGGADTPARAWEQLQPHATLPTHGADFNPALGRTMLADTPIKLVETKGVKIQLRSPMAPVVRLAFDGLTDEATIAELEQVMAWALKMNLPRGSLAERIQSEGGIEAVLNGTPN